jgi:hypothetical protein
MQSLRQITFGLTVTIASCGDSPKNNEQSAAVEPSGVSIVAEVHGLSQGLAIDGFNFTVRGWLVADDKGSDYTLYNASWDPFEPESQNGIPRISLKFEEQPSDYWVGQYTTVAGIIVTEALPDGGRAVALDQAKVVSERVEGGEVIPYRITQAQQDGTGQPAPRPESKSEGGDKPQPEAEGRSR